MGARLKYAKVIDRELFFERGAKVHPGLDSEVIVSGDGRAAAFLVLRAWTDDHGSFTERWRIEAPGEVVVYQSLPREIHMPTEHHVERLEDEVADIDLDHRSDRFEVVFTLNEEDVARLRFTVIVEERAQRE